MKVFRRALALFAACFIVSCGSKSSENRDSNGEINGSVGAGGGLPHPVGSGGSFGSSDSDAGPPSLHPEFDWTVNGGAVCYPYQPETNREFQNACEEGCVPFTTALPLLRSDGNLPALPNP
jgi:hypothetical protein